MKFTLQGRSTFPRRERLQRGHQFRHVYEQGRKVHGKLVVLHWLDTAEGERAGRCQVGVVTSRRVGGAVIRNRARRLLREAYRLNKEKLKPNLQLVLVARTAIQEKKLREVEVELLGLFQSAGLLKAS